MLRFYRFYGKTYKKNLLLKNQYPKNLTESKINKFLEVCKIDNSTFKQNKNFNIKNEKKTEIEICSSFITVNVGSCSIRFQKIIASIFQKHNIVIKPLNRKFFLTKVLMKRDFFLFYLFI